MCETNFRSFWLGFFKFFDMLLLLLKIFLYLPNSNNLDFTQRISLWWQMCLCYVFGMLLLLHGVAIPFSMYQILYCWKRSTVREPSPLPLRQVETALQVVLSIKRMITLIHANHVKTWILDLLFSTFGSAKLK